MEDWGQCTKQGRMSVLQHSIPRPQSNPHQSETQQPPPIAPSQARQSAECGTVPTNPTYSPSQQALVCPSSWALGVGHILGGGGTRASWFLQHLTHIHDFCMKAKSPLYLSVHKIIEEHRERTDGLRCWWSASTSDYVWRFIFFIPHVGQVFDSSLVWAAKHNVKNFEYWIWILIRVESETQCMVIFSMNSLEIVLNVNKLDYLVHFCSHWTLTKSFDI